MAVVLDSDAVIGFLDEDDALHSRADARVRSLLDEGETLVTSVITYAEVLTGAKLGHHDEHVVRGFFDGLISEIVPVELDTGVRAAELRSERPSLKMPDALILATADGHGDVGLVVCGDRKAMKVESLDCAVDLLTD